MGATKPVGKASPGWTDSVKSGQVVGAAVTGISRCEQVSVGRSG